MIICVAIIITLVTGIGEIPHWLSMLVGLLVGLFLVWVAFRLFDWGESAARAITWGAWIGLILGSVLYVSLVALWLGAIPSPLDMAWWVAFGFTLGATGTAQVIARRLWEENQRP